MINSEYAGFWIRLGATLIDLVVISIVIYVPLMFIYGSEYWVSEQTVKGFWDLLLGYIVPFIATIWFWLRFFGTPGKMATRLKIVDARTGQKLTIPQSIGRCFAYLVSIIPLFLGFVWVGIDKRKQGWHDKLAGTVVIRDKTKEPVEFEENVLQNHQ